MKPVARGMVVCCPKCGTIASVIGIGIGQYVCKNCKTKFTCWVVNGFSVIFVGSLDLMLKRRQNWLHVEVK